MDDAYDIADEFETIKESNLRGDVSPSDGGNGTQTSHDDAAPLSSAGDEAPSPESEAASKHMVTQESNPRGDATPAASSNGAQKSRDEEDVASPSQTGDEFGHAASQRDVDEEQQPEATGGVAPSRNLLVLKGHTDAVECLATLDGDRLVSGGYDGSIIIWNLEEGKQLATLATLDTLEGHKDSVDCLAALADGRLASGSSDRSVIIWNLADGSQLNKFEGHLNWVTCLAALDGDRLASGSKDESVIIWNLADGTQLVRLCWGQRGVSRHLADGTKVHRIEGHSNDVNCLAALGGNRLASGSSDTSILIWNLADGAQLAKLEEHTGTVYCLVALDGGRLASSSLDRSIIIWNVADGNKLATLEGHTAAVYCLAALDGDRLASGSYDNTIRIWNVAADSPDDEAPIVMWGQKGRGGVQCLVALDDGRLVSGGGDGTIRVRPVLRCSTGQLGDYSSAFEFEKLARECRENNMLDDLLDNVDNHIAREKDASNAITTQAHVFDAIAKVVNEETDPSKSIETLAPRILDLVRDESLLPNMKLKGIKNQAIEQIASSPLFRVVLDSKFAEGPRFVLYWEVFLYLALMFCFARVAGSEILDWPKWYATEKVVLLVFGFAILLYFSAREVGQIASMHKNEQATATILAKLGQKNILDDQEGIAWCVVRAALRYLLLFLMTLLFLPVWLVATCLGCTRHCTGPGLAGKCYRFEKWYDKSIIRAIKHDPFIFLGVPRSWRTDYWNAIDLATIACTVASFVLAAMPGRRLYPNLAAFTALLLWIKLCCFLKLADVKLAAFVLMFEKIMYDIRVFMFFLLVILLMFASALLFILGPRGNIHFNFAKTFYELYLLVLTGDSQLDFDSTALDILLFLILFVVVIVLLNVLITIVGNSHEESEKTAAGLFYRSRLEYIVETAPFGTPIARRLQLAKRENEWSIKDRLKDALKQHEEDASEADTDAQLNTKRALRESEEKIAAIEKKIDEIVALLKLQSEKQ